MRNVTLALIITIVFTAVSGCTGPSGEREFVQLFNGKGLVG